jgi:hypothetical protein
LFDNRVTSEASLRESGSQHRQELTLIAALGLKETRLPDGFQSLFHRREKSISIHKNVP